MQFQGKKKKKRACVIINLFLKAFNLATFKSWSNPWVYATDQKEEKKKKTVEVLGDILFMYNFISNVQ